MSKSSLSAVALAFCSILSGCGANTAMLQSITISPASQSSAAQFVATGTFSDGTKVSPLPVSWFIIVVPDIDPAPGYHLTTSPFSQQCVQGENGSFLVTAFAPQNPKAPSSGSMPENVWADMINASVPSEGGFVGGSAHFNCP